jgi:hypothetical protein
VVALPEAYHRDLPDMPPETVLHIMDARHLTAAIMTPDA